jgi:hypothetical protein
MGNDERARLLWRAKEGGFIGREPVTERNIVDYVSSDYRRGHGVKLFGCAQFK